MIPHVHIVFELVRGIFLERLPTSGSHVRRRQRKASNGPVVFVRSIWRRLRCRQSRPSKHDKQCPQADAATTAVQHVGRKKEKGKKEEKKKKKRTLCLTRKKLSER